MPHHASASTMPAVPPRADPPSQPPPAGGEARGVFAGLLTADGGDSVAAPKPSQAGPAAARPTGDGAASASASVLYSTLSNVVQSAAPVAPVDASLTRAGAAPVEMAAVDAAVAPAAVPAVSGGDDAAMAQVAAATQDVAVANTLDSAASASGLPSAEVSPNTIPAAIAVPRPVASFIVEPDADPPPTDASADTVAADIAAPSLVLIALTDAIEPQGETTRTAAEIQTMAVLRAADVRPGAQSMATAADPTDNAAGTGEHVAASGAVPPAPIGAAEDASIGAAKGEDPPANVESLRREKSPSKHAEAATERAAGTPKPEADDVRRDVLLVPAAAPNAHAHGSVATPIASIGVATATAVAASPFNAPDAAAAFRSEASGGAGVPITGLAVEIAARSLEGKRRFEIRLDPPELGRIDVRLDVGRDGHVSSRLVVERAETLDLLRRDAPALERALQSAGLRTDDAGLQFSLRDQSGGRWAGVETPPRSQLLIVPDADVAVHEAVRRGYGVLRGLGRGIDISV